MLGEPGVFSSHRRDAPTPASTPRRAARPTSRPRSAPDYEVKTGDELAEDERRRSSRRASAFFNNILLGFAGVALFVGIFLILNTFSIIVAQRTRELALMRAIGRQPPADDRLGAGRGASSIGAGRLGARPRRRASASARCWRGCSATSAAAGWNWPASACRRPRSSPRSRSACSSPSSPRCCRRCGRPGSRRWRRCRRRPPRTGR